MNAEGAQEKNKWNDVELCGIMRNETIGRQGGNTEMLKSEIVK